MAMYLNSSLAARLKNVRGLLMVNFHLSGPSGVAFAATSVDPQVKGACNQLDGPLLKLVMAPMCTYTSPVYPRSPRFPLIASTVIVILSLSFGKAGDQVNNWE